MNKAIIHDLLTFSLISVLCLFILLSNTHAAPFNDIAKFRKADAIAKTINKPCVAATETWASCSAARGNLLNGDSEVITDSVPAYLGSSTATCDNGTVTLTGSSCGQSCTGTPWGTINHGDSVTAYSTSSPPCHGSCSSQTRTCNDGTLSGSYTATSCSVSVCGVWTYHGMSNMGCQVPNCPGPRGSSCSPLHTSCIESSFWNDGSCDVVYLACQ